MKTILLVDDEKLFLSSLSEGLTKLFPQVNIVTAQNGLEAIKILDTQDVILTITDLQMPIMSGFELLDCLVHDYPGTSIIVMTAHGNVQLEDNLAGCGSIIYMEKPIDFQTLAEHIQAIIAPTVKGHLKGIDLPNILQLLYLERKTCTLTVYSKSRVGYLYFIDGELIDAEFEPFKAENAAYEILKWVKPDIEIESICSKSIRNIQLPLDFILLEAAKKQDEFRRDTGSFRKITLEVPTTDIETSMNTIRKNEKKTNKMALPTPYIFGDEEKTDNLLEVDLSLLTETRLSNNQNILEIDDNFSDLTARNTAKNKLTELVNEDLLDNIEINNDINQSENFLNTWIQYSKLIIENSACGFVKYLETDKLIILQGSDNIQILSEEISKIIELSLQLSGNSVQGSFEYITESVGLSFIWDTNKKYAIIVTDAITDNMSLIWFRRYKGVLERAFLSS